MLLGLLALPQAKLQSNSSSDHALREQMQGFEALTKKALLQLRDQAEAQRVQLSALIREEINTRLLSSKSLHTDLSVQLDTLRDTVRNAISLSTPTFGHPKSSSEFEPGF